MRSWHVATWDNNNYNGITTTVPSGGWKVLALSQVGIVPLVFNPMPWRDAFAPVAGTRPAVSPATRHRTSGPEGKSWPAPLSWWPGYPEMKRELDSHTVGRKCANVFTVFKEKMLELTLRSVSSSNAHLVLLELSILCPDGWPCFTIPYHF